jgi:hypothetical protein
MLSGTSSVRVKGLTAHSLGLGQPSDLMRLGIVLLQSRVEGPNQFGLASF